MNDLMIKDAITGLEESKKNLIIASFAPVVESLNEYGKQFPDIQALDISPEKCVKAKRFRIDFGRQITQADNIRKDLKEESLKEGKAIQSVYNYIKTATEETKAAALDIELHYEKIEVEKKAKLQLDRQVELAKYDVDSEFVDLGNMPDEVWTNYLAGVKNNFEAIKEAERKAEADRIEAEKKDAEERETMRLDNERLKVEADKAEKKRISEQKKLDAERKRQDEKLRLEREKAEAEKRIQDEIIRKEREAKEKLQQDIADKETERLRLEKVESDRAKAEQVKTANAPDKEKLDKLVSYMEEIGKGLKNDDAKDIVREAYKSIKGFAKGL